MTKQEWFNSYDKNLPKFSWFIKKYYGFIMLQELGVMRERCDVNSMIIVLNSVWFNLPDHIFNIKENPNGWNEFLYLLKEEPDS